LIIAYLSEEMEEKELSTQEKKVTSDLSQLHSHLESKRECLMEELRKLETSIRQIAKQRERGSLYSDDGDGVTDILEMDRYLAWQKQTIDHLSETEHALRKFEQGTYGLCEGCGQQIDPGRLEALPQVSLCVSCKSDTKK
jgi:RNA polymerase-binding transcription factor DksA